MKKSLFLGSIAIVLIGLIAGGWALKTKPTSSTTPTKVKTVKQKTVQPLTVTALKHDDTLAYSSIIYYAIKYGKIQRWQELNDFDLGWQVEVYHAKTKPKYLVWPDQNIKTEAKQLAPNWFTLTGTTVTYHSFVVHSFQDDMTAKVTFKQMINRINHDHAITKVRRMPTHMTVVRHQ